MLIMMQIGVVPEVVVRALKHFALLSNLTECKGKPVCSWEASGLSKHPQSGLQALSASEA